MTGAAPGIPESEIRLRGVLLTSESIESMSSSGSALNATGLIDDPFSAKGVRIDEVGSWRVFLGGVDGSGGVAARPVSRDLEPVDALRTFDTAALRLRVGEEGIGGNDIFF